MQTSKATLESVQSSKNTDNKTNDNNQPVKKFNDATEIQKNLEKTDDNPKDVTKSLKTFSDTTATDKSSEKTDDNPRNVTTSLKTCSDTMVPEKTSEKTDDNPKDVTMEPVKPSGDTDLQSKDNEQIISQDFIDLTGQTKSSDHQKQETKSEESEIELGLLISDDDIDLLGNINECNKLKLYDTVNKIKNFPGYQPKSCTETLVDILINSVALMRSLKL